MLGYKTLAEGIIRMDRVLQKQMDMELELVADSGNKDKGSNIQTVAKLTVLQLSSTPVDQELKGTSLIERGVPEFSDDEDDPEFSSGEEAELSDSEPLRSKLPHTRVSFFFFSIKDTLFYLYYYLINLFIFVRDITNGKHLHLYSKII